MGKETLSRLKEMTVKELKAYAKENGVTGYSRLNKEALIERVWKHTQTTNASKKAAPVGHDFAKKRRDVVRADRTEQYFTVEHVIERCCEMIVAKCGRVRMFIDSSCGTGEVGLYLHERHGFTVHMFDVDDAHLLPNVRTALGKSQTAFTFAKRDFMTTSIGAAPHGVPPDAIIGFNPPFGHKAKIGRRFIEHALTLKPKYMAWIMSNIMERGEPWLPPQCVVMHYECLPPYSFRFGDELRNLPAAFTIWHRDPDQYVVCVAQRRARSARALPPGYALERLSFRLNTLSAQPLTVWPKSLAEILIRTSGGSAGQLAIIWSSETGYHIVNATSTRALETNRVQSVTQHAIMRVPDALAGDGRTPFFRRMIPLLIARRQDAANKRGISMADIRAAIFGLHVTTDEDVPKSTLFHD